MDDHEMRVTISGKAVYKAVSQHLRHDEELKAIVATTLRLFTDDNKLQGYCERMIKDYLMNYTGQDQIRQAVRTHLRQLLEVELKAAIESEVRSAVSKVLSNTVIRGGF